MVVAALVEEVKQAYTDAGLDCGDCLFPPAHDADIDAVSKALRLPIPTELRELWQTHGGQDTWGASVSGLFGWHGLLTPAQAVEYNRLYGETCIIDRATFPPALGAWGSWVPELIPFASFNGCDLCVHAVSAEVGEFRPGGGLVLHKPSIAVVLEELIAQVRAGRRPHVE